MGELESHLESLIPKLLFCPALLQVCCGKVNPERLITELVLLLMPTAESGKSSRDLSHQASTGLPQQRPALLGAGDLGSGAGTILEDLRPSLPRLWTQSGCETS